MYQYIPGPPIDEILWLQYGLVACYVPERDEIFYLDLEPSGRHPDGLADAQAVRRGREAAAREGAAP